MIKPAYHATNNGEQIEEDGVVRPARMKCVYLIDTLAGAAMYAETFGCRDICAVEYDTKDVAGKWRPAYVGGALVIRLMPGKTARALWFEETSSQSKG